MAANPIPEADFTTPPVKIQDVSTTSTIFVLPGQTIQWQNNTTLGIGCAGQPVNGTWPLNEQNWSVPAKAGSTIGTHTNTVNANAPAGVQFPFTRANCPNGTGKIVVVQTRPEDEAE
jgi:hypothetical protein